ncbi:IclR family transcriptional regulator [Mesorhizobium sp. B2-7-1]|uniref:IclR family transcriptional regulator n=1 Tax=Mesorhizobium sp. B2-7-1 TaxID=2589909 RepID=UPI001129B21F|nr:IclR family transcriptional regulator [Mesorhizobium sp. B2-7-1]TPJ71268.1 IclR family transcriptional regulator [Mesorhizobium sp. B2-7-1]
MNTMVKSAARILDVLELLGRAKGPLFLKEIARNLGYPPSSTHGLLATLVAKGYARRDDAGRYMLHATFRNGPGWASGPDAELISFSEPYMRDLRDRCGETVMLGILNQDLMLKVIAKCVANRAVRYDSPFSGGVPSYCSAMGRVLLGARDAKTVDRYLAGERLVKLTPFTIISKTHLRRLFRETRQRGYAISSQEMDIGSIGVAAAIQNASGEIIAALDVAAISSRHADVEASIVPLVKEFASKISVKFGYLGS